ncbi:hypothetical protein [Alteromonas mediterranea]|uniref:Right handed beta helix domain-containing protein n=1 Tax=Alteromonas mediterranea TaxID=314275 RepID=A0AAC8XM55_9ALTE|nr:hypothetical protein [Alteromonas mediterranea]AFV87031.1 hypothetical protein amad1_17760 [Alteromonas mediterranea DE1]AGP99045.1 hypothetical protein I635_17720 [Alteromonas mediterranea UM7]AGQ03221.1 hypothetical protein I636_16955 [Alteromonas mediterranea UM4b]AMJ79950.1 hypothetical protein AV942_17490 [Alteromonas mediterranea]AMJ84105.1 hypothetical protein AV941_17565 [Alteromonas mediterranea]
MYQKILNAISNQLNLVMAMKKLISLSVLAALSTPLTAQESIPHIFSPSTPAKAAEVNENFDFLNSRLNGLENSSLSEGSGTQEFDVDCTENPAALSEAYLANKFTQNISFLIVGSCYGDITVPRVEGEAAAQVHGQVIFITGADESATLVDNDLTGNINLWASFGGGLYLRDLAVVTSGGIPVAFSRNGHGSVINVTISRSDGEAYAGVYVQEGGQVYLGDVVINGFESGIAGRNGAVIRSVGDISITDVNTGISMQNSSFRGANNISISAANQALELNVKSTWQGWGANLSIAQGNVSIDSGSSLVGTQILAPDAEINVYHSVLSAEGVTATNLRANGSMVTLTNSAVTGEVVSEHNAKVEFYDSPLNNVLVHQNSSFIFGGDSIANMSVHGNSHAHLGDASVANIETSLGSTVDLYQTAISGAVNVYTNSTFFANESTFSENGFLTTNDGGYSALFGGTSIVEAQTACHFGTLDVEGVDVNAFNNGCLNTGGYQEMIDNFKNTRNN